jgi:hypothetical protein
VLSAWLWLCRYEPVSVPMDEQGMRPEALQQVLDQRRQGGKAMPRVLYLIPCGQNPTGDPDSAGGKQHTSQGHAHAGVQRVSTDNPCWHGAGCSSRVMVISFSLQDRMHHPSAWRPCTRSAQRTTSSSLKMTRTTGEQHPRPPGVDVDSCVGSAGAKQLCTRLLSCPLPVSHVVRLDLPCRLQYPDGPDNVPGLDLPPHMLSLDRDGRVIRIDTFAKVCCPACSRCQCVTACQQEPCM